MDIAKIWADTGLLNRGIVIFLILMSITSLTVAIWKWLQFRRMAAATKQFAPAFSAALESENIPEALALADQYPKSHVARVLGESLREVAPLLSDPRAAGAAIVSCERSVEREQILLANELKSGLGLLATIGSTAPFVGLLGTTLGIVNSFMGMSEKGGGLEAVSGGIAEALIATAIGLVAAIPAVWLYNYFTAKLDTLFSELAYAGREMIDWMMTRQARREVGGATYGD
ncbi:MotA/TolQ/ExbB proton channel family protein [Longimicrobium terrae]|jgi:biopolymer transport protein ExbB|uniref:Biopolymer transport protein ExbB/biopolymer transport protein TolQ n=1 Tax=Longimicrobium terrae TaxID=1639882 RepID=A0A841GY39_9BACT|nr:MotA/TolQ/ExbB proton channel family protein [Longimicrobium terrae]MBB4636267.1 biopolymer transport protein ExbB/biopolymer transport protein TolQ [Longimicrobium terrae]MBB6070662.1 biopolymer transport protein ExbB/biopolymer transport protein TolQ [Longimicrobium terrae]NNC29645.1 flagellar motor protein MotA [Longimicrobium terrae]